MFELRLAKKYIKAQKRHSILTILSIAAALALVTVLFTAYSTWRGIERDAAYCEKPYHFKIMKLTEQEFSQLSENTDFDSCERVYEKDGSLSAAVMLGRYQDDFGLYLNTLLPDVYLYSDLDEEYDTERVDVNEKLVEYDRLDFDAKYYTVYYSAVFFIFIIAVVLMLRVMIDTAFEISAKERERQYGMLRCMGAEPVQLIRMMTFEGLLLCAVGVPVGMGAGVGLSFLIFSLIKQSGIAEAFFDSEDIPRLMQLHISPLLLALGAVTGLLWVLFSAYGTGMRLTKKSPLNAVTGRSGGVKKVSGRSLLSLIFGWKGRLAARTRARQPKRYVITVVSLTVSIMLVSTFSIALEKLFAAFEKTTELIGLDYDMTAAVSVGADDPLGYSQGLEELRECGYFDIHSFSKSQLGYIKYGEDSTMFCQIIYYPREIFEQQFSEQPPVSYDELTDTDSFLLMVPDGTDDPSLAELMEGTAEIDILMQARTPVSEEQYASMTHEQKTQVKEAAYDDPVTGEHIVQYRYTSEFNEVILLLSGAVHFEKLDEQVKDYMSTTETPDSMLILASTLDVYEHGAYKLTGDYGSVVNTEGAEHIRLDLKNKDSYESAKSFIEAHADTMTLEEDFCGDLKKGRTAMGTIQIGMGALSALIGVLAVVNMVNMISTGILNRKRELAAMQCIGMTKGQLRAMISIECMRYALTAGISATALTEGLLLLMRYYLKRMGLAEVFREYLSFTEPLPVIWLCAAASFIIALAASFIPLASSKNETLTEKVRCIE